MLLVTNHGVLLVLVDCIWIMITAKHHPLYAIDHFMGSSIIAWCNITCGCGCCRTQDCSIRRWACRTRQWRSRQIRSASKWAHGIIFVWWWRCKWMSCATGVHKWNKEQGRETKKGNRICWCERSGLYKQRYFDVVHTYNRKQLFMWVPLAYIHIPSRLGCTRSPVHGAIMRVVTNSLVAAVAPSFFSLLLPTMDKEWI